MLIEAAKGGHTNVVQLLLDYPHSMMLNQQGASMLPGEVGRRDSPLPAAAATTAMPQPFNFFQSPPCISSTDFSAAVLQEVPEAVRIVSQEEATTDVNKQPSGNNNNKNATTTASTARKSLLASKSSIATYDGNLTSSEAQQVRTQPLQLSDLEDADVFTQSTMEFLAKEDPEFLEKNGTLIDFIKNRKKQMVGSLGGADEGSTQKQQILEELHVSKYLILDLLNLNGSQTKLQRLQHLFFFSMK